jgi:sugar phosphate isomerase/epimerase
MATNLAAQLYTLRDFMKTPQDIASTMKRVKAIGYDAVQLSGLGPIDPKELANILKGEGLIAVATHVSLESLMNDLPQQIENHRLWGCKNVAIGSMPGEYRNLEGFVRFAKDATTVADNLAAEGFTFSYHNHSFEFEKFNGKLGMDLIFENAGKNVLSEIDTFWVQHGGANPTSWVKKMNGRIVLLHLKDMGNINGEIVMKEVGEGNLEWGSILEAGKAAGAEWFIVEQDVCQRDPFESLAISLKNLHAMGMK